MANVTIPWKIHLGRSGQGGSNRRGWWARRKFRDDPGKHPILMPEQDLDHLGTLHNTVHHPKKR